MSIYFIAFVHRVRDPIGQGEYGRLAMASLAASRGTLLAAAFRASGETKEVGEPSDPALKNVGLKRIDTIEGNLVDGVSLIQFPDRPALEEWYYSDAYQEALKIRKRSADTQVIIVDSFD